VQVYFRRNDHFRITNSEPETSGGFRGYAGYAAAYPIDWTGGIFVTFNFCPIV